MNDIPSAFPNFETIDSWDKDVEKYRETIAPVGGMSLRDYFAAKALQTQIAVVQSEGGTWNPDRCAQLAYEFADAMLKERAK